MNKQPTKVTLDAEKEYFWCTCGMSKKDPFCDGTHKAEGVKRSLKFIPAKSGEANLCMCKKTSNPPYCDGSHNE